jgi:hypothetical protein
MAVIFLALKAIAIGIFLIILLKIAACIGNKKV